VRQALPFSEPAEAPRLTPSLEIPLPSDRVLETDAAGALLIEPTGSGLMRARTRPDRAAKRPKWRVPVRHLESVLRRSPVLSLLGEVALSELCAGARWRALPSG